jgi:hypothetical protein
MQAFNEAAVCDLSSSPGPHEILGTLLPLKIGTILPLNIGMILPLNIQMKGCCGGYLCQKT